VTFFAGQTPFFALDIWHSLKIRNVKRAPPRYEPVGKAEAERVVKMAISPREYYRQVRAEIQKVTWPSRHETMVSTFAVFMMVIMAAIFLFMTDQIMSYIVGFILGLGL
jgi:preprotein translocase subunit SecE